MSRSPYGHKPQTMGDFVPVYPCLTKGQPGLAIRMAIDSMGRWMEVGFQANLLTGTAATGWLLPDGPIRLDLQASSDLVNWTQGDFTDCAGSPTSVGDGIYEYWSRAAIPQIWWSTLSDHRFTTDRYGKSITAIHLGQTSPVLISLPNYPYAMPAASAQLQTDLRANGHPDAVVATTAGTLRTVARNHTADRTRNLPVTVSGSDVTAVTDNLVPISLPGYPYSMPSQRAQLQTDLRAAGKTYAVVTLFQDEWDILLPDLTHIRAGRVTFTPGDPFAGWDLFGNYTGEIPNDTVGSAEENLRDPLGGPLTEAKKQFARLAFTALPM